MTLRDLIKMAAPKAQTNVTIVSENGSIVMNRTLKGTEWKKVLSDEVLQREVLSAELNLSMTGEDVHRIGMVVKVKNRTNREMLIQALRSGPLDPEAREIIFSWIRCPMVNAGAEHPTWPCEEKDPGHMTPVVCNECLFDWLDREAEA